MGGRPLESKTPTRRAAESPDAVEVVELSCECGEPGCTAVLRVSLPTLEWIRTRGLTVVAAGHGDSDDTIVERASGFLLVRPGRG
jgi:hypothetical protein